MEFNFSFLLSKDEARIAGYIGWTADNGYSFIATQELKGFGGRLCAECRVDFLCFVGQGSTLSLA